MSRSLSPEKLALARAYEDGGYTVAEFCSMHGIRKHNLYYWRSKLRSVNISEKPLFLPLEIPAEVSKGSALELSLPNGVEIRFQELISAEYLRSLLEAW